MNRLVLLASLASVALSMPASHFTDEHGCVRKFDSNSTVGLDAPKERSVNNNKYDVFHVKDAAYIHGIKMKTDRSAGACVADETYGFDQGTHSVWATGDCKGDFHIDYLVAHCEAGIKISAANNGYSEKMLTSPCMDGRSYSMEITSGSGHSCGDVAYKGRHYAGIGNKYGFHGKVIWVADGCSATFKVCEIGSTSGKSAVRAAPMGKMMMH